MARYTVVLVCVWVTAGCLRAVYPPSSPDARTVNTGPSVALVSGSPAAAPQCDPKVPVISQEIANLRAYEVISRVSVTCGVGLAQSCDDPVQERACALGADAIIVTEEPSAGGAAPTKSAILIHWKTLDAGIG